MKAYVVVSIDVLMSDDFTDPFCNISDDFDECVTVTTNKESAEKHCAFLNKKYKNCINPYGFKLVEFDI